MKEKIFEYTLERGNDVLNLERVKFNVMAKNNHQADRLAKETASRLMLGFRFGGLTKLYSR